MLLAFVLLIITLSTIPFLIKQDILLEINPTIQNFNASQIERQISEDLKVDSTKLSFTSWWGDGFSLHLLPDGTIDWIMWELTIGKESGTYDVYQANGRENKINMSRIGEDVPKVKKQGSFTNFLSALAEAPWNSIFETLPKADKYSIDLKDVHFKGENIKDLELVDVYVIEGGNFKKVMSKNIKIDTITLEMTVGALYKSSDGHYSGKSHTVLLVKL
jgi:hypothetical protein